MIGPVGPSRIRYHLREVFSKNDTFRGRVIAKPFWNSKYMSDTMLYSEQNTNSSSSEAFPFVTTCTAARIMAGVRNEMRCKMCLVICFLHRYYRIHRFSSSISYIRIGPLNPIPTVLKKSSH